MRSRSLLLPGLIAAVLAGSACWRLAGAADEPAQPVQAKGKGVAKGPMLKYQMQGAGSCASAACHNAGELRPDDRREYSLAMLRDFGSPKLRCKDRHAQAYEVLLEKRSQDIERKLNPKKKNARAENDPVCLRCHVHPDFDTANVRVDAEHNIRMFRKEDGVSCEACHGPAEKWLAMHFRRQRSDEERLADGQYDTRSLRSRAELCVRCHVGEPGLEVNHDLIAAGHPRLTFEFSSFHYLLHKHWDSAKDTTPADSQDKRGREDFEIRAWLVGQVVTAQASLRLLAHRADEKSNKPWPEFAEHDCAACHHDLNRQSETRLTYEERVKRGLKDRRPGILPQNLWHTLMLKKALEGLGTPADMNLAKSLDEITKGLEKLPLDRNKIAVEARKVVQALDDRLNRLDQIMIDPAVVEQWLTARVSAKPTERDHDEYYVQLYLARAALSRARKDQQPSLIRPTMRLLLQLPTSDTLGTIDLAEYRNELAKLRATSK